MGKGGLKSGRLSRGELSLEIERGKGDVSKTEGRILHRKGRTYELSQRCDISRFIQNHKSSIARVKGTCSRKNYK